MLKKWIQIIIGSVIAGFGLSTAVHAGFGAATLAVLWQGVSVQCHISLGTASLLISAIMILFILFYDISQIHIGTILYQIVYSYSVDWFGRYPLHTDWFVVNFLILMGGLILLGVGTGMYASVDMGRGPYEAIVFALNKKHGWQIRNIRVLCDIGFVVSGYLLGGTVGIGTIMAILTIGYCVQKTVEYMRGSTS